MKMGIFQKPREEKAVFLFQRKANGGMIGRCRRRAQEKTNEKPAFSGRGLEKEKFRC